MLPVHAVSASPSKVDTFPPPTELGTLEIFQTRLAPTAGPTQLLLADGGGTEGSLHLPTSLCCVSLTPSPSNISLALGSAAFPRVGCTGITAPPLRQRRREAGRKKNPPRLLETDLAKNPLPTSPCSSDMESWHTGADLGQGVCSWGSSQACRAVSDWPWH